MKEFTTLFYSMKKQRNMTNKKLSIAIPSYNRPEILKRNILKLLPEIREFSIQIFISDDSIKNETQRMIEEIQIEYRDIFYFRNNPNLGHDGNILQTLRLPKTDYVWLIGDSILIEQGGIKRVLEIITNDKPEIIAVNARNRKLDEVDLLYLDCNEVFDKFAWHLTLTGCTIYSKSSIDTIDSLRKNEYENFPQISLIFSHLAKKCSFYWVNQNFVYADSSKESYWVDNVFKIFLNDWKSVIRNLPICYHNKRKVILMHSSIMSVFGFKNLILYRARGAYNINIFKKYKLDLLEHSGLSAFILMIISIMPKFVLKVIINLKRLLKLKFI